MVLECSFRCWIKKNNMKISNLFTVLLYRGQLPSEANNKLWTIWLILYESYHKNRQKPINSLSFGCEKRICCGSESRASHPSAILTWPDPFSPRRKKSSLDISVKTSLKSVMKIKILFGPHFCYENTLAGVPSKYQSEIGSSNWCLFGTISNSAWRK